MELLEELRWKWFVKLSGIAPTGVIYVGAHLGENIPGFLLAGFSRILAIEPDPDDYAILSEYASRRIACVNVALSSRTGTATFYRVAGASALNSLRQPDREYWTRLMGAEAVRRHPVSELTVPTTTLDALLAAHDPGYGVLYMNAQGAELEVLRGATSSIPGLQAIITEVNFEARYEGAPLADEVTAFVSGLGFRQLLLEPYASSRGGRCGEAWFVRDRRPA